MNPQDPRWLPARRVVRHVLRPLERFLRVQAASGLALLVAGALALAWSNSPWASSYEQVWQADLRLGVGPAALAQPVRFFINDGLMVIFFFVAGLEIRREVHEGELSAARSAALPVAAAIGGMVVPALIFHALNAGTAAARGWGVPMATDIAFSVGVLSLLGERVPAALRVLVLALAIVDDVGAIVVIAIFYTSRVAMSGLLLAAAGGAAVLVLKRLRVCRPLAYLPAGFVLWLGLLRAGIHPTIAGVILGLMTPARSDRPGGVSTAVRLQTRLHPWVAFGVLPLFALANAGVTLRAANPLSPGTRSIALGVVLGLVIGKPVGVVAMSYAAVRSGLASLPGGIGWRGVILVGGVAGIGFTMAIFIAGLAFAEPAALATAKLAVLVASVISGGTAVLAAPALIGRRPE